MKTKLLICIGLAACCALFGACKSNSSKSSSDRVTAGDSDDDATEESKVVSATLITTGGMTGTCEARSDDSSYVMGTCPADMWANFGIKFKPEGYEWANVALMTKDPIPAGYTGPVKLDWMDVSFFTSADFKSYHFKGPATFEITKHDSSADSPRMVGRLKGSGLKGSSDSEGQTIDAEFNFDVKFACGLAK